VGEAAVRRLRASLVQVTVSMPFCSVDYSFVNKGSLFKLVGHSLVVKSSSSVDIVFLVRSILSSTSCSLNSSSALKLHYWKDLRLPS
jgi:hypothetical protein